MKKIFFIICLAISAAILLMTLFPMPTKMSTHKAEGFLAARIPDTFGAMKSIEKPLGATEEVIRASENLLSVSDYLNREYTLPDGTTFSLYISFWLPNTQEIIKANTHTPDRCWVTNGWKSDLPKKIDKYEISVDGKALKPGFYREYTINNTINEEYRRKALFWFIADGKIYDYSTSSEYTPNPVIWLKTMIKSNIEGSPEMFFIRLDSESDLSKFIDTPEVKELLKKLGEMILFNDSANIKK